MNESGAPSDSDDGVNKQVKRGISWNLIAAVPTNIMRIVALMVLGRVLHKADFGVVAAAVTVNALIVGLRDLGIGLALVQRKDLDEDHYKTAFAASLALSGTLVLGLFLAAPLIADLFQIPRLTNVVRGLAPIFLLSALTMVSRAKCQRELRFGTIAAIDTSAFLIGSTWAIVFAFVWGGPWALVTGYLLEDALLAIAYIVVRPPSPSLRISKPHLRDLLRYGLGQTAGDVVGNIAIQADNAVVGRYLGELALASYSRAYDLVRFPSQLFSAVVGNVLFPSFAKIQNDKPRVAEGYLRAMYASALLLLPASAYIIVCAPEIIRLLIGSQWGDAVLPFQLLATMILFRTTMKLSDIIIQTQGNTNMHAIAYFIYMVMVIGGSLATVSYGKNAVAGAVASCIFLASFAFGLPAMRACGLRLRTVAKAHLPGLLLAGLVAGVAWPLANFLRHRTLAGPLVLTVVGVVAVSAALAGLLVVRHVERAHFAWLIASLRRRR